jgi:hypothetical protein
MANMSCALPRSGETRCQNMLSGGEHHRRGLLCRCRRRVNCALHYLAVVLGALDRCAVGQGLSFWNERVRNRHRGCPICPFFKRWGRRWVRDGLRWPSRRSPSATSPFGHHLSRTKRLRTSFSNFIDILCDLRRLGCVLRRDGSNR